MIVHVVSWVRVPPEAAHFFSGKVTALGVLCCFALFVCLTLLASFFLPSHLSLKTCIILYCVYCIISACSLCSDQGSACECESGRAAGGVAGGAHETGGGGLAAAAAGGRDEEPGADHQHLAE